MFEVMHDPDGGSQAQDVSDECSCEVNSLHSSVDGQTVVDAQTESNEDTWDDDVSQAQHREVVSIDSLLGDVLRYDQLDWGFKALCHCDHDVCAEHPKHVIEEETPQENASVENTETLKNHPFCSSSLNQICKNRTKTSQWTTSQRLR